MTTIFSNNFRNIGFSEENKNLEDGAGKIVRGNLLSGNSLLLKFGFIIIGILGGISMLLP